MLTFLTIVYVFVCAFLILVVLLQSGKGGGMGALGGGAAGSTTVFGGAGAGNFLTRLTAICAALFMILSATLAYLSTSGEQGLDRAVGRQETGAVQATDAEEPGGVVAPGEGLGGQPPEPTAPVEASEEGPADEASEADFELTEPDPGE